MESLNCQFCKRYQGDLKCEAFPERIPDPILSGEVSHEVPYPGDKGLLWDPSEGYKATLRDFGVTR